ncbi:hypothetical protein Pmani_033872 [Petrolisthes manimaculis]|uniref:Uncharacterized protein n=1 Tax=Petrolisthes manimaculis TaxID=1843537 RepID=A0AAE1NR26_9EUCA|nr:hypothetical protein Pmani_033872 [Petrolisthes manimaculis]
MSVAVSTGLAGAGEGGGGGEMSEMCGWRQEVRAKVTALKCHVMASRGLTTDGHIVAPYSPHLLLDAANLDFEAYAEVLQNGGILSTTTTTTNTTKESTSPDPDTCPESPSQLSTVSVNDVHLRLETPTPKTTTQKTSSTNDSPTKSSSPSSQQPSPGHSPQSSPIKQQPSSPTNNNNRVEYEMLNGEDSDEIEIEEVDVNSKDGDGERDDDDNDRDRELARVKKELKAAESEVERLSSIRDEVEAELQDLTATLFQLFSLLLNGIE